MPNDLVHFAIHADEPERAKRFYESVFGWLFEPWGPPEFWQIFTSESEHRIRGALHRRTDEDDGLGMRGFECTIGVEDVLETANAIEANGGKLLGKPYTIGGVGTMVRFEDTEQNRAAAMQYLEGVKP